MNESEISVVIPACDRPDHLQDAVDCVLAQTRSAHEVIIVDNSLSPLQLSKSILKGSTVIRTAAHGGVSQARNTGAAIASGSHVAFLDDDDLWEKDYLSKVADIITRQDPSMIVTRLDILENGRINRDRNADGQLTEKILLTRNPGITGSSTIVKKDVFLDCGGFNHLLRSGEDKALCIEFLRRGELVVSLPEAQAIMREHSGDRLTSGLKLARGIEDFMVVYGNSMSFAQKQHNYMKLWRHRKKALRTPMAILRYTFHKYLHELFKLTK